MSALVEANLAKFLANLFEKLHRPPMILSKKISDPSMKKIKQRYESINKFAFRAVTTDQVN